MSRQPAIITTVAACALLLIADAALAGWPTDPAVNLPVCTATGEQSLQTIVTDGQGGAFVLWRDRRSGTVYDLYGQHVDSQGLVAWVQDGVLLDSGASSVEQLVAAPNGAGGFFVACQFSGAVSVDHVAPDPTRPTTPGRRTNVLYAPGETPAIAANDAGEVTAAWFEDHGAVDSLRIDRWRPDPTDDRKWLRVFRAAKAVIRPVERLHIADDGLGGAWMVHAERYASTDQRFKVYVDRVVGSSVDPVSTLPWTGELTHIADYSEELLVTPDGGLIVVWDGSQETDPHPIFNSDDIFALFLDKQGTQTSLAVVADAENAVARPKACPDGAGGAIVTWIDKSSREIRVRHVASTGTPGWPATGVLVSGTYPASGWQVPPAIAPTTDGGAFVAWPRSALFAQRVSGAGWTVWTAPAAMNATTPIAPVIIADGADGALAVWQDRRNEVAGDIYMQRMRGHGVLSAAASITGVTDLPGDQGGRVRIEWDASALDVALHPDPLDGGTALGISVYGIWRRIDAGAAASAIGAGAPLLPAVPRAEDARPGVIRTIGTDAAATFWEGVGMVPARGQSDYSFVAATLADSMPGETPWETFMVDAHERTEPMIWDSAPDSGYSVDNLAPPAPVVLSGAYGAGTTSLHWNPIPVADLVLYRVYAGGTLDFVTDADHRIAETPDTVCVDSPGGPRYYKVTGLDVHGNEGVSATFDPGVPVEVGGPPLPGALRLAPPSPNPAVGRVTFNFALPRQSRVELAVHDLQGRRVRMLVSGVLAAGEYVRHWDGCDGAGRAPGPGLYLVRLRADGRTAGRKFMLTR